MDKKPYSFLHGLFRLIIAIVLIIFPFMILLILFSIFVMTLGTVFGTTFLPYYILLTIILALYHLLSTAYIVNSCKKYFKNNKLITRNILLLAFTFIFIFGLIFTVRAIEKDSFDQRNNNISSVVWYASRRIVLQGGYLGNNETLCLVNTEWDDEYNLFPKKLHFAILNEAIKNNGSLRHKGIKYIVYEINYSYGTRGAGVDGEIELLEPSEYEAKYR